MSKKRVLIGGGVVAGIAVVIAVVWYSQGGQFMGNLFKVSGPIVTTPAVETGDFQLGGDRVIPGGTQVEREEVSNVFKPVLTGIDKFNGESIYDYEHVPNPLDIVFGFNVSTEGPATGYFTLKSVKLEFDGCIGIDPHGGEIETTAGNLAYINSDGETKKINSSFFYLARGVIQNIHADPEKKQFEFRADDSKDYAVMIQTHNICNQDGSLPGTQLSWGKVSLTEYTWEDESRELHTESARIEGKKIDYILE
ncbi:hypothetical protein ACFL3C_04455 [Patescibacteria group bacterium]